VASGLGREKRRTAGALQNGVARGWLRQHHPAEMKIFLRGFAAVLFALAGTMGVAQAGNWPAFRGVNSSGVAEDAKPPLKIGPTNNVLWQVTVPWSPSSPVVWGDRLFLTTFADGELQTECYDARTGRSLWSRGIKPEKVETYHRSEGSPAASTPATDGQRVVSYFGSFGLICFDFKGKELWRRPLPLAESGGGFGTGTSPTIAGKLVILNRDLALNSSIMALDVETGKTVWETPRMDANGSFGTPILWDSGGVQEVVAPGSIFLRGYDLRNGKERWVYESVAAFSCPTPVIAEGMLFFAAWSPGKSDSPWPRWEAFLEQNDRNKDGHIEFDEFDASNRDFARGMDVDRDGKITKADFDAIGAKVAKSQNIGVAIKPGAQGKLEEKDAAWTVSRGLPYVPSPVCYQGRVYLVKDGGMVSSLDAKTGNAFYSQERLEATGSYYASPIAAEGKVYLVSLPGKLTVIKAGGDKPEILHQTDFRERVFATPALSGKTIYLRTEARLYAFEEK
jgi:outer membrane protein assembly factor BamB